MNTSRIRVPAKSYLLVYAVIAFLLLVSHAPLFDTPFFWDEAGQFIPASLDILREARWIPHSTLPNVHPPLVMAVLAGVWKVVGFSIPATRIVMLLIAAFAVLFSFLLSIELSRNSPGAPALITPVLICVSPLFFAQAMLAQLDMPAMAATALALLLFIQNRFRAAALTCVALVLIKETGIAVPLTLAAWLIYEKRPREAAWFALPFVALVAWLVALKLVTGHWLGNTGFTDYNVFYPLHPARLTFALLRRFYFLFIGSGHIFGTATLILAFRRMPLLKSRSWRIVAAFAAVHTVLVSALGGAVLERYLLPVLPVLYAAFALSLRALIAKPRKIALGLLLASLVAANFINPVYPFPFENNLSFVSFTQLQSDAATDIAFFPGVVATTFPLADALRKPDLGYVNKPRQVTELKDFTAASIAPLNKNRPDLMLVYTTEWDPFHILTSLPARWFMQKTYSYNPPLTPQQISQLLSMQVARTWTHRGLTMSLLVRAKSRDTLSRR